ncbi:hypothetical protein DH09_00650 (plasmid) [Bacillaceae bacterium JMAK1]|nr:hypothetical protein DH09_00650 [Bacillaceae bacterium JMAK1]
MENVILEFILSIVHGGLVEGLGSLFLILVLTVGVGVYKMLLFVYSWFVGRVLCPVGYWGLIYTVMAFAYTMEYEEENRVVDLKPKIQSFKNFMKEESKRTIIHNKHFFFVFEKASEG